MADIAYILPNPRYLPMDRMEDIAFCILLFFLFSPYSPMDKIALYSSISYNIENI